jgi:hypothetical protein
MNSRILFLGTAGDSFVIGKQRRNSGGILFSFGETQFHIDPGPGALVMARLTDANLRENTAILITKDELGRANDVNAVISAMTHDGFDKRGVLIAPEKLIKGEGFGHKKYLEFLERAINIEITKKIAINDVEIEIIDLDEDNFGYKILTPRFNLAYIPETGNINRLTELNEIDILILNIKEPKENERSDCLYPAAAELIIKKIKPQLTLLTGFGAKMLEAEPLYEAREMQKNTNTQIIAVKDGMSINPTSFAATMRQKKLNTF